MKRRRINKLSLIIFAYLILTYPSGYVMAEDYTFDAKWSYSIAYTISVLNVGSGSISDINLSIALPQTWEPFQSANVTSISPIPHYIFIDKNGNRIAYYYNTTILAGQSMTVTIESQIDVKRLQFYLDQANIGQYDTSSSLYKEYTTPEEYIEASDSLILDTANIIAGQETNPYLIAKKFYDFVTSTLTYEVESKEMGALWALQNGRGDCTEFTDLFAALCRAKGIPVNVIKGWALPTFMEKNYEDNEINHVWTEVFFPNYGWVPVDPTWGRSNTDYFGYTDGRHIILAKGHENHLYRVEYKHSLSTDPRVISSYYVNVISVESTAYGVSETLRNTVIIALVSISVGGVVGIGIKAIRQKPYNW